MVAGGCILAGSLWLALAGNRHAPTPAQPAPDATTSAAPVPPEPRQAAPARTAVPAPIAEPARPSFDIVRVSPTGDAVIAGRAAAGSEVSVTDNGREIGRARADAQGQFVLLPSVPLPSGGQELQLSARSRDGTQVQGDASAIVIVPPQPVVTARPVPVPPARASQPTMATSFAPAVSATTPAPPVAPAPANLPASPTVPSVTPPPQSLVLLIPRAAPPQALQAPPQTAAAAAAHRLALGVVDYDELGRIRFSGSAPPGVVLRVYVDNVAVSDAMATAEGSWTLNPGQPIAAGDHRLRIDQLSVAGQVANRVELPFRRAKIDPSELARGRVVVQPGQSLWVIARAAYGQGVQYSVIYEANRDQIRNPDLIYPGQIFAVPTPGKPANPR